MAFGSYIQLYRGVPLDPNYEHTLLFGSAEEQKEYFSLPGYSGASVRANLVQTFTDFSFIRKEGSVKIGWDFDRLYDSGVNYAVVQNDAEFPGTNSKPRFYFVRDLEYVSSTCTKLILELDVMQTYQFEWELPACFIEREHVAYDEIGGNLLPEGLELGNMEAHSVNDTVELDDLAIVMQSNVVLGPLSSAQFGTPSRGLFVDGVYSGFSLWAVPATQDGVDMIKTVLETLDSKGVSGGIQSIWMYPKMLLDDGANNNLDILPLAGPIEIKSTMAEILLGYTPGDIGGYHPRNLKLFSYPFMFAYVYNNVGSGAVYKYELFEDRSVVFRLAGNLANDGVVRLIPMNYRGYAMDNESGLTLGGFPTCAWNADLYKIWMAQTAASQNLTLESAKIEAGVGILGGAVKAISGAVTGKGGVGEGISDIISSAWNGYMKTATVMAAREDKQVEPPQAKGVQSAPTNIGIRKQNFSVANVGISADYAARIDSYFDMYGYRVSTVKVPDLRTRPYWNFIRTMGCVVLGDFSAADRRKIAAIFDNGVTLWHSPSAMYKYTDYADLNLGYIIPDTPVNPEPDDPEPDEPETPTYTTMYCNVVEGEYVNIRSGPSTSDEVVGKLHRNDEVSVESIAGGWAKIVSPTDGYVMASYLQEDIPGYG